MTALRHCNVHDLREKARRRLPGGLFQFVDRGSEDERSLRHNREVFGRIRFRPRTLVDVSARSQQVSVFGKLQHMPVAVGPTGTAGMMWFQGDVALARAAKEAGVPFTCATGSITSLEEIARDAGGTLWFQLYMAADRSRSEQLIKRAHDAGYEALFVTVDGVVSGNREYNLRHGFTIPFRFSLRNVWDVVSHPRWLLGTLGRWILHSGMPRYRNFPAETQQRVTAAPMGRSMLKSDALNWEDIRWVRSIWPGKLVVKGILRADDALLAVQHGCDGVVVSNHGGRNLDGAVSPIEALPEVVAAVGSKLTVFVDGGVRRGADVVKALALGAHCVLLGRSTLYGIGAAGGPGAARVLEMFRDEISRVLALLGCPSVSALNPDFLHLDGVRFTQSAPHSDAGRPEAARSTRA